MPFNPMPPLDLCVHMFRGLFERVGGDIKLEDFDFVTGKAAVVPWRTLREAAELVSNSTLIERASIGACTPGALTGVWIYPDWSGDIGDVGRFSDAVCKRMSHFIDSRNNVGCITFYRVPTVKAMGMVLERFHAPGTVSHAVICGHGKDFKDGNGTLALSLEVDDDDNDHEVFLYAKDGYANTTTSAMVATLGDRLADNGTLTILSCWGGTNGVAKMFSDGIGDHWVFGGVISLHPKGMVMAHTEFVGGADGPVRVATDTFSAPFLKFPPGEAIVAWYKGQNMGLVTQWMYPSRNGKVVRCGCHVVTAQEIVTVERASTAKQVVIAPRSRGIVRETFTVGVANDPQTGDAIIEWFPNGTRSLVAAKDFGELVATSCSD